MEDDICTAAKITSAAAVDCPIRVPVMIIGDASELLAFDFSSCTGVLQSGTASAAAVEKALARSLTYENAERLQRDESATRAEETRQKSWQAAQMKSEWVEASYTRADMMRSVVY